MKFTGLLNESLFLSSLNEDNFAHLKQKIKSGLFVFWNLEDGTLLSIDRQQYVLKKNQLVFLSEFHIVEKHISTQSRFLFFNRLFYCINHNPDDDCNGLLFYGAAKVPIIDLPIEELDQFESNWNILLLEMQRKDDLQIEMLRSLLKQIIIKCTRLYKEQNNTSGLEQDKIEVIRRYNSSVEMNYKSKHHVADYAVLLSKSPKTLSNIFSLKGKKTPLQIIQDRILLEARRLLCYTDRTIKEISHELGFEDIQTFSRFFKNKELLSPSSFRKNCHIFSEE
ncbi:MAG: helix-turn-helix domain-containing protein [Chitinophagaceae bacterium]